VNVIQFPRRQDRPTPACSGPPNRRLPMAFHKARAGLRKRERSVLAAMLEMYWLEPGRPVAVSVRDMGSLIGSSPSTAARALSTLEAAGFIVSVAKGDYLASRYRLTALPCEGLAATQDYLAAGNWTHKAIS